MSTPMRTLLIAVAMSLLVLAAGPALASASSGSRTLTVGSTGKAVKQLQRKLHVQVTGYYGTKTRAAVKRFQRRHGLKADGIAGPATLSKLGIHAGGTSQSTGGTSPGSGRSHVRLPAILRRIAECESHSNPRAVSADGQYRGKYQFTWDAWRAYGGKGDPAKASEAMQDRVALRLYRARGTAPWPYCGSH